MLLRKLKQFKFEFIMKELYLKLDEKMELYKSMNSYIDKVLSDNKERIDIHGSYKRINSIYFRLFQDHCDSVFDLFRIKKDFSAMVLGRTLLEVYVKSFYFEFILKSKPGGVLDYLAKDNKNKFPPFHVITDELGKYSCEKAGDFKGHFEQFTKVGLGLYSKFSSLSHANGEFIDLMYKSEKLIQKAHPGMILEVISLIIDMYEAMFFLFLKVQGWREEYTKYQDFKKKLN